MKTTFLHPESQGPGSSKTNPASARSHLFSGASAAALAPVVGPRPNHRKRRTKHHERAVRGESCSEPPWARDDRFVGACHGHLSGRRHVSRPSLREEIWRDRSRVAIEVQLRGKHRTGHNMDERGVDRGGEALAVRWRDRRDGTATAEVGIPIIPIA